MIRIVVFGLTLALFSLGCGDDVAAPTGVDEPYSIYGIMNPRLETQTMLVAPTSRIFEDYPEAIDAVVTTTNLETGESLTWEDSVVTGQRGQRDHVFVARFRPDSTAGIACASHGRTAPPVARRSSFRDA